MLEIALPLSDMAFLFLRLLVALVFGTSGWAHLTHLEERSKSIGLSKPFTAFLGIAEVVGALGLATGVLARWAALGLILIMLGAIYKKLAVWKTGFWGKGSQGWHYDLLFVATNFVIFTAGPGRFVIPLFRGF
jgi:putative oxidoreductase